MQVVETKAWYKSRSAWATISTVVIGVLAMFKVTVPEGLIAQLPDMGLAAATAVVGLIGVYGTFRRESKIGLKDKVVEVPEVTE